ncbi:MAG: rubredoxin [Pseudoflavonifractor sp.]
MKKYVCSICGYVYEEAKGIPASGIAAGTLWEALPAGWVCPLCGASKSEFRQEGAVAPAKAPAPVAAPTADEKALTALELSALCSNLARGCEKQYLSEEQALFTRLSDYFKAVSPSADAPETGKLLRLIEGDLEDGFPLANAAAAEAKDRGALRALVWSEKVTRILNALLTRYEQEGDAMLEHTGVYVCTICGFVFVGDAPPEICPVCKVPSWKFEKIEEGAQ